jgi:predicted RNA-binding Zn ribbon-like protein
MDEGNNRLENLELLGGHVCLDFINTVDWRGSENPQELLQSFQDLILWGRHASLFPDRDAQKLLHKAVELPIEAEKIFKHAIALRETLYRIFAAVIQGTDPQEKDLRTFNEQLSQTMIHARIMKTETGFAWDASSDKNALDRMLNPIIRSAADLLVSDELKRVKTCADAKCGWLFLDKSRNNSRRWCNMQDCGNRAKVSRFYRRKQQARYF